MNDHPARKAALSLLEYRSRTRQELKRKLRQKGYSEEETEDAVGYCASFGYLNDRAFAELYILNNNGKKSRQRIFQELIRKGLDRETAASAWEDTVPEEYSERSQIEELIEKKLMNDPEPDEKALRRVAGFLLRRGFRPEDVRSALMERGMSE